MTSLKFSKFNFSAAIRNIYAQFAQMNSRLNSSYFMLKQIFRKYFRYALMTSLNIAISSIYAQFVPVNRGLNSAYFMLKQLF